MGLLSLSGRWARVSPSVASAKYAGFFSVTNQEQSNLSVLSLICVFVVPSATCTCIPRVALECLSKEGLAAVSKSL